MIVNVPTSLGDLIDKISILLIKKFLHQELMKLLIQELLIDL